MTYLTGEKLMGRTREELGFQCPGRCGGLTHGSTEIIIQENRKREIGRSDNDVDPRSIRLWPNMKPVEYAWKNKIETRVEIDCLIHKLQIIKERLALLSETDQQKIGKGIFDKIQKLSEDIEYKGNERRKAEAEFDVYVEDNEGNRKREWNPIEDIRNYRNNGDLLYPLIADPPSEFYRKVLGKHPYVLEEYFTGHEQTMMQNGWEFMRKYRQSIHNKLWRYTMHEWFMIAKYAETEGVGKTSRMLTMLDGDIGKLSSRYVRRNLKKVAKYMTEFKTYLPHYFRFLGILNEIIENDLVLNLEWSKILKQREICRQDSEKRIEKEYLNKKGLALNDQQDLDSMENTYRTKGAAKRYDDVIMDNGIIEVGNELIRISHTTDKGRICCGPFHLCELPQEAIELLRKEGKIRPLS